MVLDYMKKEIYVMEIKELERYIEKKILVVLTDGRKIIGEFDSVAPDYDTESGKDELELFVGGIYITVPIDEVKNIKMV